MGTWKFNRGQKWDHDYFVPALHHEIDIPDEEDKVIELSQEDLLIPGFIDFHCHAWAPGALADFSIADQHLASVGTAAYIDGGSFGYNGWEAGDRFWRATSIAEVRSLLNIRPEGFTIIPNPNPSKAEDISLDRIVETVKKSNGRILGVKLALGLALSKDDDQKLLELGRKAADKTGGIFAVHIAKTYHSPEEIAAYLKPKDVLVHPFHGERGSVLMEDGTYAKTMFTMKDAGITMDVSAGKSNLSWKVAKAAFTQGFKPDIISTDQIHLSWNRQPLRDLPHLLSAFVAGLGMPLNDAFMTVITKPQQYLKVDVPYSNNLVVLKKYEGKVEFLDSYGEAILGDYEYVPMIVIRNRKVLVAPVIL